MKKLTTVLAIIIPLAAFPLWNNILKTPTGMEKAGLVSEITGNLTIEGNLDLKNESINPGCSPGRIDIIGNFSMGSQAVYKAELKDLSGPGLGHDQINVSGNITLGGTLEIILDGYSPTNADQFEIMAFGGTLNGNFTNIILPASMSTWMIDYGVMNPNKVVIHGPNSPLPIALLNFTVDTKNDDHILSWQTAAEFNNDYFLVEHSTADQEFRSLQQISSMGNSNTVQSYSYTHNKPSTGDHYYRLKQVDKNGDFTYSHIISINMNEGSPINIYPNPSSEVLHFSQKADLVIIYDFTGKEVIRASNIESNMNISGLPAGTYVVDINNGTSRLSLVVDNK